MRRLGAGELDRLLVRMPVHLLDCLAPFDSVALRIDQVVCPVWLWGWKTEKEKISMRNILIMEFRCSHFQVIGFRPPSSMQPWNQQQNSVFWSQVNNVILFVFIKIYIQLLNFNVMFVAWKINKMIWNENVYLTRKNLSILTMYLSIYVQSTSPRSTLHKSNYRLSRIFLTVPICSVYFQWYVFLISRNCNWNFAYLEYMLEPQGDQTCVKSFA